AVVNSAVDELSCVMLTGCVPVLVSTADCVDNCPTFTSENVKAAGVIWISSAVGFVFEVLGKPAQPLNTPVPAITAASSAANPDLRVTLAAMFPFTASLRTISALHSGPAVRWAEYVFNAREKYW